MAQNGSVRPFSAICVHYCVTTGHPRESRSATVYTNGPERRRRAVFANLCTLLRPPVSSPAARATPASQQCTQMAQNGSERTFSAICVHYCVPCVTTGRPCDPRVAIVYTNGPERRRRDVFADLCTLLCPHRPPARASRRSSRHNSVHKCPETASRGRFRRSVYTIASPCVPTAARVATVYTNGPERLREAVFGDLCTLLRPPASPRAARVVSSRSP